MRALSTFSKIFLYCGSVDFRRQANGLAVIAEQLMKQSPMDGSLFVFISRDRRKIRLLYWDDTGMALWSKSLVRQRYAPPNEEEKTMDLTWKNLDLMLKGYEIFKLKPHEKLHFNRYS